MHLLLIAQYFWPETVGAGVWIHQLATDFTAKGHRVTVLTAFPNYPGGRIFPNYKNRLWVREEVAGIQVIRTYIYPAAGKSFWPRAVGFGSFCASSLWGGLLAARPDVIYAVLPPLPLGWTAELLGLIKTAPVVVNIQDIFPDIAVSLSYLRNSAAIRFFKRMERSIYRHARSIVVIGESFRQNLTHKGVPDEKIRVIPNWADADAIRPAPKFNAFRASLKANGNLLVMYSGGMGLNTCLNTVLDAARILAKEPQQFVLIGEGAHKASLEAKAKEYSLQNIRFLPFVPAEEYAQTLAASDVQLVALNEAATQASLPSKVLKIMASGRPVLALARRESELSRLVERAGCGLSVAPNDAEGLADALRRLAQDPEQLEAMGTQGRNYLVENFDRKRCVAELETVLRQAVHG